MITMRSIFNFYLFICKKTRSSSKLWEEVSEEVGKRKNWGGPALNIVFSLPKQQLVICDEGWRRLTPNRREDKPVRSAVTR